jgi:hypothetical protein
VPVPVGITRMKPYELDPRWQQAYGNWAREDYPGASVRFAGRMAAAAEMCRIESAYEADPGLIPPRGFELTPVHDPARCRARRLAAKLSAAEAKAAKLEALLNRLGPERGARA